MAKHNPPPGHVITNPPKQEVPANRFFRDPQWLGVIAAFLAVFATIFANCQQLSLYENATHDENRAYLFIDNPKWDPERGEIAFFDITNQGKTPAYKVAMGTKLVFGDTLTDDPRTFPRGPGGYWFTLGPNAISPHYVKFDTSTKGQKVFLYGKVTYYDKFGKLHFTSFSYVYETKKMAFYPGFNDAD